MSKRYVENLVKHKDQKLFLAGLWIFTGYKQVSLEINKHHKGTSTYNVTRKINSFIDALTSFSNKPLIYIFYTGIIIFLISSLSAFYLIYSKLFFNTFIIGWASLLVSIWMIGGLTIFCIGIVGIYLSIVFEERKQRPYTVIRQIYSKK